MMLKVKSAKDLPTMMGITIEKPSTEVTPQKLEGVNFNPSMYVGLSENMVSMLNARINSEELSSRIYLAMSLWLEDKGYFNAAKLWAKYASEENNHANWAREHLLSFNIRPKTMSLMPVENEYTGLDDIIRKSLEHEMKVTYECKELAKAAFEEMDMNTFVLAQKYVKEQSEELNKVFNLTNLLDVYGTDKLSLALLDHELEKFI